MPHTEFTSESFHETGKIIREKFSNDPRGLYDYIRKHWNVPVSHAVFGILWKEVPHAKPEHFDSESFHRIFEIIRENYQKDPDGLHEYLKQHWGESVSNTVRRILTREMPNAQSMKEEAQKLEELLEMETIREAPLFDHAFPAHQQLLRWKGHNYLKISIGSVADRSDRREFLVQYSDSRTGAFKDSPIGTMEKIIVDIGKKSNWSPTAVYYSDRISL